MPLASIQKVSSITPIPGADNIESVGVLGWNVVAKKGEFHPDDLCIYVEIDTLIPRTDWSEFLFDTPKKNTIVIDAEGDEAEINTETIRLRAIKLRGQVSYGLVLPVRILEQFVEKNSRSDVMGIGHDVSDLLGIKKYEKPIPVSMRGILKGSFPSFISKTDEIRIQSNPKLLEHLEGSSYYITQKLDGTSATYYKYKGVFGVCSRNMELKNPKESSNKKIWWRHFDRILRKVGFGKKSKHTSSKEALNVYWEMAEKYDIERWLPEGFAIQGEICGPGIQGNKLGLDSRELFIFNVYDIENQEYRPPHKAYQYENGPVTLSLDVRLVPLVEERSWTRNFELTLEHLLDIAKSLKYPNGSPQEGIVVRSLDQRISFKVINEDFLFEYGE